MITVGTWGHPNTKEIDNKTSTARQPPNQFDYKVYKRLNFPKTAKVKWKLHAIY